MCASSHSHQLKNQEYFQQPSMSRILHLPNYIGRDLRSRMYHLITDIKRVDPALEDIQTDSIYHLKDRLEGHGQVPRCNKQEQC